MATTEGRNIFNNEYVQIYTNGSGNIVLLFEDEKEKPLAVGQKMNEINEEVILRTPQKTSKKQNALPTSSSL